MRPASRVLLALAVGALVGARAGRRRRFHLAGRVVLVTGGSRGLGLALARRLVREGARVAICARDRDTLDRAHADLQQIGAPVLALTCDVTDREAVVRTVGEVTERLGPIDVLVNNAGTIVVGPVDTMDAGDFHHAMDVNFWGPLHVILAVLPSMRARRAGRIVNIASIGGKISVPHLLPYNVSKFALVGLSEGLRAELRQAGVLVTTICPGLMRTGSPRHALFKGRHDDEYAWFSISDALPGLSMDADRAAAQIVQSLRRGDAERVLSVPAKLGATAQALFPGVVTDVLGVANRWLPAATGPSTRTVVKGEAATSAWSPSLLTRLGDRAAATHNQTAGHPR